jgi:hypothetical protein
MRRRVKLVLLSALLASGCLHETCNLDCDSDGDPDCRADVVTGGSAVPPAAPPAPLAVACRSLNNRASVELEWELGISGGTPRYDYTIDFGDQTPPMTGTWSGVGSAPRGHYEYAGAGDYQMTAQVRDQRGQVQSCLLAYTAPNPDLRLRCTATPRTGTAPLTVTFEAPASGREGCIGPCEVTWDFGDGETFAGGRAVHVYELPGPSAQQTYAAFATLIDSLGRTAQCRVPIQVLPNPNAPPSTNRPPSVDYLAANPSSITAGGSSTIVGMISDPDPGDTVGWSLSFDTAGAGSLSPTSGAGPDILSTYTSAAGFSGTAVIRVAAVDSAGAVAYRTVSVSVAAAPPTNRPPVISGFSVSPGTIFAGGPAATLSATVSDPDGDPVTWQLELDSSSTTTGAFTPASGNGNVSSQFAAPGTAPMGQAVLRLTVSDGSGGSAQATVTVIVVLG